MRTVNGSQLLSELKSIAEDGLLPDGWPVDAYTSNWAAEWAKILGEKINETKNEEASPTSSASSDKGSS